MSNVMEHMSHVKRHGTHMSHVKRHGTHMKEACRINEGVMSHI